MSTWRNVKIKSEERLILLPKKFFFKNKNVSSIRKNSGILFRLNYFRIKFSFWLYKCQFKVTFFQGWTFLLWCTKKIQIFWVEILRNRNLTILQVEILKIKQFKGGKKKLSNVKKFRLIFLSSWDDYFLRIE